MKPADADSPGWRTREKRRLADLAFLDGLRTATSEELDQLEANHAHKKAPQWKRVAIARAKEKLK